jgi:hypothetical protein
MLYSQKLNLFKRIVIIGIFFSIIPLTIVILILGEISLPNNLFNNYLISGKSLFFPFLPSYNVFWFLPEEAQIIQFSTGHLIDIILITSIISLTEICGYQYYKKICLNEDFLSINQFGSDQENYILSQYQGIFFGFNETSSFSLNNKPLDIKNNRNQSFSEGFSYDLKKLGNYSNRIDLIQNRFFLPKSFTKFKKKLRILRDRSILGGFTNILLNYDFIYPQIEVNVKIPHSFQYRGINLYFNSYHFKKFISVIIKMNYIKNSIRYIKKK